MATIYRTTDLAKWGAGKGSNLTPAEVDNNFYEIRSDVQDLKDNPPTAAGISNIEVIGTQMKIFLSNGDSYGPYTLPYLMFKSRGDWAPATLYNILDLVVVPQQGLFLVNINHESDATFDPNKVVDTTPAYTLVFPETAYIYDISFFYPGKPGLGIDSSGYMAAHSPARPILFQQDLTGSVANLRIAPAAALSFPICKNGVEVGSVDFALGEVAGTFTFDNDVTFAAGDVISLSVPTAGLDANARDLNVTFIALRE